MYLLGTFSFDSEDAVMEFALEFLDFAVKSVFDGPGMAHVFLGGGGSTMAMRDLLTSLSSSWR